MSNWVPISPWKLQGNKAQKLTATATSQQSTAFGTQTFAVMVSCMTANVHIEIGANPVASATTSMLLKTTDPPLVLGCGAGDMIAVIQDSSGGVLYVTELTH